MKYKLTPFNAVSGLTIPVIIWAAFFARGGEGLGGVIVFGYGVLIFCVDFLLQFAVQVINKTTKFFWLRIVEVLAILVAIIWSAIVNF